MCKFRELTDEELVERIRAGESSCMDVLIERYKRQVRNQARTLYLMGGDNDDLIQEGMLGLFKAIRDYRPQKEASFEAFARLCILRLLRLLRLCRSFLYRDLSTHQDGNSFVIDLVDHIVEQIN